MLSPRDTAYPVLKSSPSARELDEVFTPILFELGFAEQKTKDAVPRIGLLVLLKTFQRLGYFVKLAEVPRSVVRHIAATAGYPEAPTGLSGYDASSLRFRHMGFVLAWVGVSAFDKSGRRVMLKTCVEASRVREDLADIINFALEELVRQRYELPTFATLLRVAQKARATVNRGYYGRVAQALDAGTRDKLNRLFIRDGNRGAWDLLKSEPRRPTAKELKRFVGHLTWLREQAADSDPLSGIPAVKVNRFEAEARALNVARMSELIPEKRYALAAALVFQQRTRAFDDAGEMFIRLVHRATARAKELLKQRQAEHMGEASGLIRTLRGIVLAYASDGSSEERLQAIGSVLGPDMDRLIDRCEEHEALMSGNEFRLLPSLLRPLRSALLLLLEHLPLESTTQDDSVRRAITFLLAYKNSRGELLPVNPADESEPGLSLSFVPEN